MILNIEIAQKSNRKRLNSAVGNSVALPEEALMIPNHQNSN